MYDLATKTKTKLKPTKTYYICFYVQQFYWIH